MWSTNKNVMRIMFYLMILISIVSLTACKEVTSEQLPPGSKVQVNPEELNWTIANNGGVCNYDPGFYQDHMISIMVLNESDNYIPDAPVKVSLDLSANTFTGIPVLALYNDTNANGVVDGPSELVTDSESGIFETHTDDTTGTKYLILRVNLSCQYKGTLYAFSDGYMGTLSIIVEEEELTN